MPTTLLTALMLLQAWWGVITLLAIGYIGYVVGDSLIIFSSFTMAAAILGFFIWNYPRGLIFLGDGGAYIIGFWVALLSVVLVFRYENISPWFALLVNGYPILETLFTIYRRKIHQGKSPGGQMEFIFIHYFLDESRIPIHVKKVKIIFFAQMLRLHPLCGCLQVLQLFQRFFGGNQHQF